MTTNEIHDEIYRLRNEAKAIFEKNLAIPRMKESIEYWCSNSTEFKSLEKTVRYLLKQLGSAEEISIHYIMNYCVRSGAGHHTLPIIFCLAYCEEASRGIGIDDEKIEKALSEARKYAAEAEKYYAFDIENRNKIASQGGKGKQKIKNEIKSKVIELLHTGRNEPSRKTEAPWESETEAIEWITDDLFEYLQNKKIDWKEFSDVQKVLGDWITNDPNVRTAYLSNSK